MPPLYILLFHYNFNSAVIITADNREIANNCVLFNLYSYRIYFIFFMKYYSIKFYLFLEIYEISKQYNFLTVFRMRNKQINKIITKIKFVINELLVLQKCQKKENGNYIILYQIQLFLRLDV